MLDFLAALEDSEMTFTENIRLESKEKFERSDIVSSIRQKGGIQGTVNILAE